MSVVSKVFKERVGIYNFEVKYEFNLEDIGMCVTTTMDSGIFKNNDQTAEDLKKQVKGLLAGVCAKSKQVLKQTLGEDYGNYIKKVREDFANYILWMPEALGKDTVTTKIEYTADGEVKTFVNGRLKTHEHLGKGLVEKIINVLRSVVIYNDLSGESRALKK